MEHVEHPIPRQTESISVDGRGESMKFLPANEPYEDKEKIQAIIEHLETLTWVEGGLFTSPDAMEELFCHVIYGAQDETLRSTLLDVWERVKGNFITTGKAVTWIAMQDALIEELHRERDAMIEAGYEACEAEILAEEQSMALDTLLECGCDEEEANMFLQELLGGNFDPKAQALIRQLVSHVYMVSMGELA